MTHDQVNLLLYIIKKNHTIIKGQNFLQITKPVSKHAVGIFWFVARAISVIDINSTVSEINFEYIDPFKS